MKKNFLGQSNLNSPPGEINQLEKSGPGSDIKKNPFNTKTLDLTPHKQNLALIEADLLSGGKDSFLNKLQTDTDIRFS